MKNRRILVCFLLIILCMNGCVRKTDSAGSDHIYYLDSAKNRLHQEPVDLAGTAVDDRISDAIKYLRVNDKKGNYSSVLGKELTIENYRFENDYLELLLVGDYEKLSKKEAAFLRAGLVKTFMEFPEIIGVELYVNEEPLLKEDETPYGYLTTENFSEVWSDDPGEEEMEVVLYFPQTEKQDLKKEKHKVQVLSYETIEKRVVLELMKGPNSEELISPVPANSSLLSVTTIDYACYVNFDKHFLEATYSVEAEQVVRSIADSLKGLNGVDRVFIQVEGSSEWMFLDTIDLREAL